MYMDFSKAFNTKYHKKLHKTQKFFKKHKNSFKASKLVFWH